MSEVPTIKPEWLAGITMTQAQKDQWLAALRSGHYRQIKGCLHDVGGFCCMGVAAVSCLGLDRFALRDEGTLSPFKEDFLGPYAGGDWSSGNPESIQSALAYLNDVLEWKFPQIADFIEANIPACDAVQS